MYPLEDVTGAETFKKRSSGVGILDGLRRTFANFLIRPPSSSKDTLPRKNMTLPRMPSSVIKPVVTGNVDDAHILVTERLLEPNNACPYRRFSAYAETPAPTRAEFIRLDKLSGGSGELLPRDQRNRDHGHMFCAIPLELDTFCDHCEQPIWGLGWGPVCQRCADCHMTCHWLCKDKVSLHCEASPPQVLAPSDEYDDEEEEESGQKTPSNMSPPRTPTNKPCIDVGHIQNLIIANDETNLRPTGHNGPRAVSVGPELAADSTMVPRPQHWPTIDLTKAGEEDVIASSTSVGGSAVLQDPRFSLFVSSADESALPTPSVTERSLGSIPEAPLPSIAHTSDFPPPTRHHSMLRPRKRHPQQPPNKQTAASRRHTTALNSPTSNTTAASDSYYFYDFSSLDKEDARERGISVWQLSPARQDSAARPTAKEAPAFTASVQLMSARMQATGTAILTGYRTGAGECSVAKIAVGPRGGALPWKPTELARRLEIFRGNDFGLTARMSPKLPTGDCEGQVRLHINLLRPVRMVLASRPPSIFDIVGDRSSLSMGDGDAYGDDSDDDSDFTELGQESSAHQAHLDPATRNPVRLRRHTNPSSPKRVSSFRLPRGSSKLLHVRLSTTANHVIANLLGRFNINDNPQKFALYEHTIVNEQEVSVRKLFDNESPLGLLLRWTLDEPGLGAAITGRSCDKPMTGGGGGGGCQLDVLRERFNSTLAVKRIVLQENETDDIEWSCFSLSELRIFLDILNKEEADYRRRIELKHQIRKREILRLMDLRSKCQQRGQKTSEAAANSDELMTKSTTTDSGLGLNPIETTTGATITANDTSSGSGHDHDGPAAAAAAASTASPTTSLLPSGEVPSSLSLTSRQSLLVLSVAKKKSKRSRKNKEKKMKGDGATSSGAPDHPSHKTKNRWSARHK